MDGRIAVVLVMNVKDLAGYIDAEGPIGGGVSNKREDPFLDLPRETASLWMKEREEQRQWQTKISQADAAVQVSRTA